MGCLFRLLFLPILVAVIGLPAAAVLMGVERTPLVARSGQVSMDDLRQAQLLAQRYDPRRMDPAKLTAVTASEAELNTVLKGVLSGLRQAAARVKIDGSGVAVAITAELPVPQNPLGRYVNVRAAVAPSRDGLTVARLAIGRIELPAALVLPVLRIALDSFVGDDKGGPIVESVRSVRVAGSAVTVAFRPPPSLVQDIKSAALRQAKVSHPRTVQVYWKALAERFDRTPPGGHVSLAQFTRPLFQLARERSETRDPVRENEGALIALAMFFGDLRFEKFVGEVVPPAERSRPRGADHVRLDGRHDFVQHFAISLGLALTGGTTAADLIGELKEVKDSAQQSGFSFTDIGAAFPGEAVGGHGRAGILPPLRRPARRHERGRLPQPLRRCRQPRLSAHDRRDRSPHRCDRALPMTDRIGLYGRESWVASRRAMEADTRKHTPRGVRARRQWPLFESALAGFGVALRGAGLWRRGVMNALDLRLTEIELAFPHLPPAFDGYRVLHLADLHLDAHPALARRAAALARRAACDLCVLTGDYRYRVDGPFEGAMKGLARLLRDVAARDGTYAILGNHDTVAMVPAMERLGIRVLANQTVTLARGREALHVTGIDDVHYFYTRAAAEALGRAPEGFRLALVHSPELVKPAAEAGIALYLTGHTHGGQIRLPGGLAPIVHIEGERRHAAGLWREGEMTGYTSSGVGVSGLPVRFRTRGELALITLRRDER